MLTAWVMIIDEMNAAFGHDRYPVLTIVKQVWKKKIFWFLHSHSGWVSYYKKRTSDFRACFPSTYVGVVTLLEHYQHINRLVPLP
jgi:hypothetical protein